MSCACRGQVAGYSTANDHFDDWISSSLAIYVLSTTENYPNVGEDYSSSSCRGPRLARGKGGVGHLLSSLAFVLHRTANPAFEHKPYIAGIFFTLALFILLWLVLPLVLAKLYDLYKGIHVRVVGNERPRKSATRMPAACRSKRRAPCV